MLIMPKSKYLLQAMTSLLTINYAYLILYSTLWSRWR